MQQRKDFIDAALRQTHSFSEVCRRFGISRKTGYKWLNRYKLEIDQKGLVVFENRSRRPRRSPTAIDPAIEAAIVDLRKARPTWGPKKLRVVLARMNPDLKIPSESTFATVLKRHGLIKPRRRRSKTTPYSAPLGHANHPNAVWSIDFKGDFVLGRTRCYPLTITDAYSRYIIACVALTSTQATPVRRALERIFDEYGLPEAIRTDNGSPFSSKGVAGLSVLSVWWHKLGIRHERIEPGHPEQNGRHERMHRDLKADITSSLARTIAEQQRCFDRFRGRFNLERPHEALGQRTPFQLFEPSTRCLPEPKWGRDFDYDERYDAYRVSKLGYVATRRGTFFLSTTLQHQLIALHWYERNRARVIFGTLLLGELDAKPNGRGLTLRPVAAVVEAPRPRKPRAPTPRLLPMSSDNTPF